MQMASRQLRGTTRATPIGQAFPRDLLSCLCYRGLGRQQMLKLGLRNVRRLQDVSPVEVRPITLLVGRNSSGKSTFLRTFPLMRQSMTTNTSAPILWFGDLVDYGDYETVVSDNDVKKSVGFVFELPEVVCSPNESPYFSHSFGSETHRLYQDVRIELVLSPFGGSRVEHIILSSGSSTDRFDLLIDYVSQLQSIKLNGKEVIQHFAGTFLHVAFDEVFPSIYGFSDEKSDRPVIASPYGRTVSTIVTALAEVIAEFVEEAIDHKEVQALANAVFLLPDLSQSSLLKLFEVVETPRFLSLITSLNQERLPWLVDKLTEIWKLGQLIPLLSETCRRLQHLFSEVLYIGPARASSQRYYRLQDLSVSKIDPDGTNFPMFLNSLYEHQLESFSDWVHDLYGYRVSVARIPGHISIEIEEGHRKTNVADTGYGISQVLPVLGQIWWAWNSHPATYSRSGAIVAIEQPELHLHPAHQALLADALAAAPKGQNGKSIHYLIETHSETLVNRLGELIGDGRLEADDVQIVIFEAQGDDEERTTKVSISHFDEHGRLIDWPYGFFQPEA